MNKNHNRGITGRNYIQNLKYKLLILKSSIRVLPSLMDDSNAIGVLFSELPSCVQKVLETILSYEPSSFRLYRFIVEELFCLITKKEYRNSNPYSALRLVKQEDVPKRDILLIKNVRNLLLVLKGSRS